MRPQVRYGYTALSANYRDGSGTVIAGSPVYRLTSISQCRTTASCAGTSDEVKTTIAYGANDALLPVSVTTGSGDGALTATVTTTYTPMGDVSTVDGPLAGTDDATRTYYDAARRPIGTIGPDPDGGGGIAAPRDADDLQRRRGDLGRGRHRDEPGATPACQRSCRSSRSRPTSTRMAARPRPGWWRAASSSRSRIMATPSTA
ncbi:MAG: hypothetical protein WDN44_14215 [Sphingomonas sp.]